MEPSNYHFHHLILKSVLSTLSSLSLSSLSASSYLSILIYIIYFFMCHFQGWRQTQSARVPLVDSYQCHLWQLVISDHFNLPKSIKQPKTLFSARFGSLFCFYAHLQISSIILLTISTSISFLSSRICNINLIETAKVDQIAKNFIFGCLDHSKM